MLLLLTEPPDLEEKEETKEDVEDNPPATKDLNALRLVTIRCWHPFDMFVLLLKKRESVRENEEEFLLESEEYLCLFLNAFDLGCTTLILKIALSL